jgi:O-methyltransferase involved in polyketide biosynthesis
MSQVIQNVSDTAFMVAGFRAAETEREEPLFRDPLAAKLAGEHGRNILADDLRRTERVRYWIVDYFSPEAIKFGAKLRRKFMRNAPFQFAPKDWFAFFAAHGWKASELRYISEEAERLGRPIPLPLWLRLWVKAASVFASRARRERMRRFAAYVLLVPSVT